MIKAKHIALVIFLFNHCFSFSRVPPGGVNGRGYRFSFGPTLGFYSINTRHAQPASSKMSALVGLKKEIRVGGQHQNFFLFGVDYFFHGVNFRSYHFDQDTLQLYNQEFLYDYSVFIQEIHLPLQAKFSFTKENNSLFSPYLMIGYHLRILMPAKVTVSRDGGVLERGHEELKFRNSVFGHAVNSFVSLTFGWQKNTINNSRTGFFVEAGYRYGFSQYFFETKYAPSSLYIQGSHLSLMIGLKF